MVELELSTLLLYMLQLQGKRGCPVTTDAWGISPRARRDAHPPKIEKRSRVLCPAVLRRSQALGQIHPHPGSPALSTGTPLPTPPHGLSQTLGQVIYDESSEEEHRVFWGWQAWILPGCRRGRREAGSERSAREFLIYPRDERKLQQASSL